MQAREEFFITTKVNPHEHGYDNTLAGVQESLRRLQLQHVDLLLVHSPMPFNRGIKFGFVPVEPCQGDESDIRLDTWRACEECLRRGWAKSIGVSNFGEHHLDELLRHAELAPSVNQVEVSPFNQRRDLVAYCAERGIHVQAWASLTQGQQLRPRKNEPWPEDFAKAKNRTDKDGISSVLQQVAQEARCSAVSDCPARSTEQWR